LATFTPTFSKTQTSDFLARLGQIDAFSRGVFILPEVKSGGLGEPVVYQEARAAGGANEKGERRFPFAF
jgi:hypothetical protein